MKSTTQLLFLLSLAVTIAGCVSNPRQSIRQVSEQKAFMAQLKQDEIAKKNKDDFIESRIAHEKWIQDTLTWKQPHNKSEECRLWFSGDWPENIEVFWDGGCKDGYAYGLGREFVKGMRSDQIIDTEEVAYYPGGKEKPIYLTSYDRVKQKFILRAYGEDVGVIEEILEKSYNKAEIFTIFTNDKYRSETGYRYGVKKSSSTNDIEFIKFADENNMTVIAEIENAAKKMIFFDGIYSMEVLSDGRVFHIDNQTKSLVELPKSYIENAEKIVRETKNAAQEVWSMTRKSQGMLDYYKKNVCKDSVKVSFVPDEQYKEICGEGYFSTFLPEVEKTREEKLALRKAEFERWIAKQEQAKQDAYRQQMANAARRQAEAAERANLHSSLESLNNTLRNVNNNLGSTMQNPVQMYSPPRATFYNQVGNSMVGSDGTICTRIGNSVICN